MTNSSSVTSTNAYDPKQSTSVWNPRTPSAKKTRRENQQMKNNAENLILRLFNFIVFYRISSNAPVSESMMKPRTAMSFGTSGCVLMVSTVLRTDSGVSLNPSNQ